MGITLILKEKESFLEQLWDAISGSARIIMIKKEYFMKKCSVLLKSHLKSYPSPKSINLLWNLGFLIGVTMFLQILTGILLGLHYTPDINSAYSSVMHILREVYFGWTFRGAHACGASILHIFIYLHLGRALYYGSYFSNPNTWFSGICLFLLLMATAFLGYVLPWGQMSFWGATVITNLLSGVLVWCPGFPEVFHPQACQGSLYFIFYCPF